MIRTEASAGTVHVMLLGTTARDALVQLQRMDARAAYSLEPIRVARVMFDLIHGDLTTPGQVLGEGETTVALEAIRRTMLLDGHRFEGSDAASISVADIARSFSSRLDMVLLLQPCPGNRILTSVIADLGLIEAAALRLEHERR
jgi:hypothetical protein